MQFTDTDGNSYNIKDVDERKKCIHTYQQGEVQKHNRTTNHGCAVNSYLAKVCIKCNITVQKELKTRFLI